MLVVFSTIRELGNRLGIPSLILTRTRQRGMASVPTLSLAYALGL